MTKASKRLGRPFKPPLKGKRVSLGLKVTADVKRHIDAAARASGRTQSQEAERLIEQALTYNRMLEAMRTSLPEIQQRNAEADFRRRGYTVIHDSHGDIWLPPGHPAAPKPGGFIPQEEER
jgi:hypothetical protein